MTEVQYPRPIIVGCGYLGREICNLLETQQQRPVCIIRSAESQSRLARKGRNALILDLDKSPFRLTNQQLPLTANQIYYFAPPSSRDEQDHYMDNFLEACKHNIPNKIVYISTSGVYGDCRGSLVSENAKLSPITDRAKRRVYAEQSLTKFCVKYSCSYVILRVGGIYGAERLPLHRLDKITVICPDEAPVSNRIHIIDLARICQSAMNSSISNEILNVSDGHSTSMTDYYYKIADLAGLPRPRCVPMSQASNELSPAMLSFVNESRQLSVEKLNSLLHPILLFPNLETGLQDCFNKIQSM